jgi:predicted DNA-binding protein with PD1-like motif
MKVIARDSTAAVLRFDAGEEVIAGLKQFCAENTLLAASFSALGLAREVELAYFEVDSKEYLTKTFSEELEIASVVGNVGTFEEDVIVHAHGVFADRNMATKAGHINKLVVGATCEVTLIVLPGELKREYSEDIGLKLLK